MKKAEIIERYGEAEYARRLEQKRVRYKENPEKARAYYKAHKEEQKARSKKWREDVRVQRTSISRERAAYAWLR